MNSSFPTRTLVTVRSHTILAIALLAGPDSGALEETQCAQRYGVEPSAAGVTHSVPGGSGRPGRARGDGVCADGGAPAVLRIFCISSCRQKTRATAYPCSAQSCIPSRPMSRASVRVDLALKGGG